MRSRSNEEEVRRRWAHIRDYFQRVRAQREGHKRTKSSHLMKRKWYLYDQMAFMEPFVNGKNIITNNSMMETSSSTKEEDVLGFVDMAESGASPASYTSDAADTPSTHLLHTTQTPSTHLHTSDSELELECDQSNYMSPTSAFPDTDSDNDRNRKHHRRSYPQHWELDDPFKLKMLEATKSLESKMLEVTKRLGPQQREEEDEDDHFFKSLLPKMKQLSIIEKMECQSEIQLVVLKYLKKIHQ